jgi:prepilin-type N-terminal cleavage/methylation domain-containing protein
MGESDLVLNTSFTDKCSRQKPEAGFTIIEIIVTVVILGLFLGSMFQMFIVMESQRYIVAREANASDVAYTNLNKFNIPPVGVTCSASGTELLDSTTKESVPASSKITDQSVKAYPVNGCDGTNFRDNFVKIESTVTYEGGATVTHASYVR